MNKYLKTFVAVMVVVLLVGGTVALASGGLTNIEQRWLDYRQAVVDKQVEEGKLDQDEADEMIADLEQKLSETEEDDIYQRFSQRQRLAFRNQDMMLADIYAELTDRTVDEIEQACNLGNDDTQDNISVIELAQQEGKLDDLKDLYLEKTHDALAQLVDDGKITQEQMDERLEHVTELLQDDKFSQMGGYRGGMMNDFDERSEDGFRGGFRGKGMRPSAPLGDLDDCLIA